MLFSPLAFSQIDPNQTLAQGQAYQTGRDDALVGSMTRNPWLGLGAGVLGGAIMNPSVRSGVQAGFGGLKDFLTGLF